MTWQQNYKPNEKMDKFMEAIFPKAVTYDDVLVKPARSDVKPGDVDITSYFSRDVPLKRPFVSAAMDTVTESRMAIEMASLGGIGVIHRNMSKEEQAEEVERTKYALNVLIEKPITFRPEATVGDILKVKEAHRYHFNSFPIVDNEGKLVGLVTGHHMFFRKSEPETVLSEFMTSKINYGSKGMSAKEAYAYMKKVMLKKLPLVYEQGRLAGMYDFDDLDRVMSQGSVNVDEHGQLVVAAAIGSMDFERAELLIKKHVNAIVVDAAHAHTKDIIETVRELTRQWNINKVAGNIAVKEAAEELIDAGADGLKVGMGPGSICTTRIVSGAGMPQVKAIYEVAQGARGRVPICADGGIRFSGDLTKAGAAGAQSFMFGSLFAGTDESPGEIILHKGRRYKKYRGMGSLGAMKERQESRDKYRQQDAGKLTPEGVEGITPCTGPLEDRLNMLEGGLRSGMGYAGTPTIADLNANSVFVEITPAGVAESHPHDIEITEEAPNYPGKE